MTPHCLGVDPSIAHCLNIVVISLPLDNNNPSNNKNSIAPKIGALEGPRVFGCKRHESGTAPFAVYRLRPANKMITPIMTTPADNHSQLDTDSAPRVTPSSRATTGFTNE